MLGGGGGSDAMVHKALASVPLLHFLGAGGLGGGGSAPPNTNAGGKGASDSDAAVDQSSEEETKASGASLGGSERSELQEQELWVRRVTLRAERRALRLKNQEHISAFDDALYELSKERLVLSADLKVNEMK